MVANTVDNNTQQTKKLQETLKVTQDQLQGITGSMLWEYYGIDSLRIRLH